MYINQSAAGYGGGSGRYLRQKFVEVSADAFITEQELQLKNRQKSIERFLLTKNERLTPGAKQFLTDHQIPIVTHDETDTAGGSSDEMMKNLALVSKHKTFFPLLEVELWEAALEARNVCSASCERITALTQLVKKIVTQNLEELPCSENEKDQPIELSEISEVQIFSLEVRSL
ncbi:hypothetical protein ABW365_03240 [Enterococcus avium]